MLISWFFLLQPLITASLILECFEEVMPYSIYHKALMYCNCFLYHNCVFLARLQHDTSALTWLTSM